VGPTLKIEKHSSHGKTTIRLIGRFQWEHVDELKKQIQSNGKQLALDLQEVTLVDLGVVQFLALCEADGIDLLYCPPYIREWIRRERQA
jgi:anti-anti-sigma regulatory factor